MREKFPSPNTPENKEQAERPPRFRTIREEGLKQEGDEETVRVLECNGHRHRECVDVISHHDDGELYHAEQLSKKDMGPCTCNKK